jgi:hypothetical protein
MAVQTGNRRGIGSWTGTQRVRSLDRHNSALRSLDRHNSALARVWTGTDGAGSRLEIGARDWTGTALPQLGEAEMAVQTGNRRGIGSWTGIARPWRECGQAQTARVRGSRLGLEIGQAQLGHNLAISRWQCKQVIGAGPEVGQAHNGCGVWTGTTRPGQAQLGPRPWCGVWTGTTRPQLGPNSALVNLPASVPTARNSLSGCRTVGSEATRGQAERERAVARGDG